MMSKKNGDHSSFLRGKQKAKLIGGDVNYALWKGRNYFVDGYMFGRKTLGEELIEWKIKTTCLNLGDLPKRMLQMWGVISGPCV